MTNWVIRPKPVGCCAMQQRGGNLARKLEAFAKSVCWAWRPVVVIVWVLGWYLNREVSGWYRERCASSGIAEELKGLTATAVLLIQTGYTTLNRGALSLPGCWGALPGESGFFLSARGYWLLLSGLRLSDRL